VDTLANSGQVGHSVQFPKTVTLVANADDINGGGPMRRGTNKEKIVAF